MQNIDHSRFSRRRAFQAILAAVAGIGVGNSAFGQFVSGDTQYDYQNSNGNFSTGFTPAFTTDATGELNFGGVGPYTATDDLPSATVNNLSFTNSSSVTIGDPGGSVLTLATNGLIPPSIFVDSASSALINPVIGGSAGFTKFGLGTLTLGTAVQNTGPVTLGAGTLITNLTSGTPFGTASLVVNRGTLSVAPATVSSSTDVGLATATVASQTLTLGGGATLALTKGGNNSVTLTAGSGSGAGLTFNAGGSLVIQPTLIADLGVATATVGGSERLIISGTAPVNTGNANLVGIPIVAQASPSSTTADFLKYDATNGFTSAAANYTNVSTGNITTTANGIYNITPGTPNPILLTGNNTIAGLRVGVATLSIGNSTSKTLTIGNNASYVGSVILNGGTVTHGSSSGGGTSLLNFGLSQGAIYTSVAGGTVLVSITGSNGLLLYGPGVLSLATSQTQALTNNGNTYTGTTFLAGGTVNLGVGENPNFGGPLGKQLANAAGSIVFTGGTMRYSTLNTFDYSGRFSTAGNNPISIDTNGQIVTFGTVIQGSGTSLTKLGTGTLNSSVVNTYTGGTTINAGSLVLSGANDFGTGGVTVTGGAGTFSNNNIYSGGTTVNGGSLTLGGANTFGVGSIAVAGGTLNLSNANTGTGATRVTGGTLNVTNGSGSATGSGAVAVNGGSLTGSGIIGGNVTVGGGTVAPGAAGVTLTVGGLTYNSGTLNFSLNGAGPSSSQIATTNTTFTATPTITFTGTGTVANGQSFTLLTSANAIGGGSFLTSIAPTTIGRLTLTPSQSGNNIVVNASGAAANLVWAGGVAGLATTTAPQGEGSIWNNTQNASASNWNNGGKYDYFYDADNVTFNDAGNANLAVNLTTNNAPGSVTVNSARNYVFSGAGAITGAGNLSKSGSGTLTLSTVNSYTGGTTISDGTLTLGVSNALPVASGTLTVQGTGNLNLAGFDQTVVSLADGSVATGILTSSSGTPTLTVNNSTASAFSGTISGSLALKEIGASNLTVSGPNTFTGGTTVSSGTVIAASDAALGSAVGAGLLLNPSAGTAAVNFTSVTPSIASLASSGAGASSVVLGNVTASTATTLTVGGAAATTSFGGVISDAASTAIGNLTLSGGQLTLAGANTFTGATSVTGGTLVLSNSLALQNSTLNGNGGAISFGTLTAATVGGLSGSQNLALTNAAATPAAVTLTVGNNNVTSSYMGTLSGLGSLTKVGSGTVTIGSGASGGATYSGPTLVSIGTLQLGGVTNVNQGAGAITVSGSLSVSVTGAANLTLADTAQITTTGVMTLSALPNVNNNGAATVTIKDNAQATVGSFRFGDAGSRVNAGTGLTIQDSGSLTVNGNFDLNNTSSSTPANVSNPAVNLNGGTLAVQSFIATQSSANIKQTVNLNGGTVKALANDGAAAFLPAKVGLTVNVQTGGAIVNTNTFGVTIAQPLVHGTGTPDGGLTKSGAGTLTLSAANNTYTGATVVKAGTLALNAANNIAASSSITVGDTGSSGAVLDVTAVSGGFITAATQTLKGIGTINGNVTVGGGTLSAGNSVGTLTQEGNFTLSDNSTFVEELEFAGGNLALQPSADLLHITNTGGDHLVTVGAGVTFQFSVLNGGPGALSQTRTIVLVQNDGATLVTGDSTNAVISAPGFTLGTLRYDYDTVSQLYGSGNDIAIDVSAVPAPVPEPTSVGLLGMAGAGLLSRRRRRVAAIA